MKYETTKKAVMNGYYKIIGIGYCDAQYLLLYKNPTAYTHGIYGWNADVYDFGTVAIVTGYRPFGNTHPDWSLVEEYNKTAERISNDRDLSYDEKCDRVNTLLDVFIKLF